MYFSQNDTGAMYAIDTALQEKILGIAFFVFFGSAILLVIRRVFRNAKSPPQELAPPVEEVDRDTTKCICGALATEPLPTMERTRGIGDSIRGYFSMPPRYRRILRQGVPVVCRAHAYVADSMVEHFINAKVYAAFSEAYQRVAIEAASFDTESMEKFIEASLTDAQRKIVMRKSGPVTTLRILPKTGTDDEVTRCCCRPRCPC